MEQVSLYINGKKTQVSIEKNWTLLFVLREVLGLTGAKCGCSTGDCGACKVIIDGEAVNSCLVLARNLEGKKIETIEGLSNGTELHPIQQAFIDAGAVQCGYCTPGIIMTTEALLAENPHPDEEEIKEALAGNYCRCISHYQVLEAVKQAAREGSE